LSGDFEKKVVVFREGEIPCLLVYSDEKHVKYINEILSIAEDKLRDEGFKPQRLGKEIRSDEDYLEKITSLMNSSALVVIILDGLRPNVIFEFGFAKAKQKPIIILKSKKSIINH
jgi:nucleoside 2-deoxyribosyltransferase